MIGPVIAGMLLAAGAGRRMGRPKALMRDDDGTSWLLRAVSSLRPCDEVIVVLGASAEQAATLLPFSVARVHAPDWATGQSASLRAGLDALSTTPAVACIVTLVDLPDIGPDVVSRLLAAEVGENTLARAAYAGVPGHPVVLGRAHWAGVLDTLHGDAGAKTYLAQNDVALIECGDLATGHDRDRPGTT